MKNTVRLILFIALLLNYFIANACDCGGKRRITVEDFNSHDWIFVGTLVREFRTDNVDYQYKRTCVYKVITAYKGVAVGDTVHVCDPADGAACGLVRLTIGRDFLIYATGRDKKCTGDCSRTTRVPIQQWPRDSALINKQKELQYFGRIFDTAHTNFHADTSFLNQHVLKIRKKGIQKFYDDNGVISAEGEYVNGIQQGFWIYYKKGKASTKGKYANGLKDGMWTEGDGEMFIYIKEYKAGEFTRREEQFYKGKISRKSEPIESGKRWIEYNYHGNEQPRFVAYAKPPKRNKNGQLEDVTWHGPFKTFNKNGVVLDEGLHDNGYMVGHWKYYYEDGKLRMEGSYEKGDKIGTWKIYYPNKIVKAVGEYQRDKKNGVWRYYDSKGKTIAPDPKMIEEDEDWFTYSGVKN